MLTRFSDGTICNYCSNLIFTKVEKPYKQDGHTLCSKECADDFKKKYLNCK